MHIICSKTEQCSNQAYSKNPATNQPTKPQVNYPIVYTANATDNKRVLTLHHIVIVTIFTSPLLMSLSWLFGVIMTMISHRYQEWRLNSSSLWGNFDALPSANGWPGFEKTSLWHIFCCSDAHCSSSLLYRHLKQIATILIIKWLAQFLFCVTICTAAVGLSIVNHNHKRQRRWVQKCTHCMYPTLRKTTPP